MQAKGLDASTVKPSTNRNYICKIARVDNDNKLTKSEHTQLKAKPNEKEQHCYHL